MNENYFGKSNLQQDVSLQNSHLFLLASIFKVATANALLKLRKHNLFSLDDTVNNDLPFEVNIPDHPEDITFRMLLTLTSALADESTLDNSYYYGANSPVKLNYYLEN